MMPLSCWLSAEKKYWVFSPPPLICTSVSYDRLLSPYTCRSKSWNPPLRWNHAVVLSAAILQQPES